MFAISATNQFGWTFQQYYGTHKNKSTWFILLILKYIFVSPEGCVKCWLDPFSTTHSILLHNQNHKKPSNHSKKLSNSCYV